MLADALRVTSVARCPRLPDGAADVLTISDNPTLGVYLAGLFQQTGWKIAHTRSCAAGMAFARDHGAAVVVCEEILPDGAWDDAAAALAELPHPPALIVVGGDQGLPREVAAAGGFDALVRPLREADVMWTIASAWHGWVKHLEGVGSGGEPCPGA